MVYYLNNFTVTEACSGVLPYLKNVTVKEACSGVFPKEVLLLKRLAVVYYLNNFYCSRYL